MEEPFRGKKNPCTGTPSQGLFSLCQIYSTCNWWGNWLLVGRRTTYLHISMLPVFQTGWWCCRYMFEPMFLNVERCFPYVFLHCSLIFRQAFSGAVTRQGDVFPQLATLWCLTYLLLWSVQLDFQTSLECKPEPLFPYIWFTYSSVRPGLQTGLFPEPLRGRVMFSDMLWCITYNYMIIAARFSDGTGILHWCRYYEVAAEVTFYIVNFQWLSFDLERDTFPDLWWRFVGAPRTLLWGSLAKRCCNGGEIQTIWSLQCYAEFWNAQLKTVCATLGSLALYLPLFTIEFKLLLRLFPEPIRGRVFFIFSLIIWCITYKYMLIARFSDGHGIQYNVAVTWRSLQIWLHCQLQGDFIWFLMGYITRFVATVSWCTSNFALRVTR